MHRDTDAPPATWLAATLLWLAGNALRLTILAVPPVLATIRDDFRLSATQVGLLSSVPPALFAIGTAYGVTTLSPRFDRHWRALDDREQSTALAR